MKTKIFSIFISIIILTGCSGSYNNKFNKKEFEYGNKSVVAFTQFNNSSRNIPVLTILTFKDEKGKEVKIASNKVLEISMIPSGKYSLVGYKLYGSQNYGKTSSVVNLDFSNYVDASFDVLPGKAVYLGKVLTIITKDNSNILLRMFTGISADDLEFKSELIDDFKNLDKEQVEKIEKEIGMKLENHHMQWKQK